MSWSRKYECCVSCGTNQVPYGGFGLCEKCYKQEYAKVHKDWIRQRQKQWYERKKKEGFNFNKQNTTSKIGHDPNFIFVKFDNRCFKCGSIEHLQFHHKDGKGLNVLKKERNNSVENLQVLCRKCHSSLHGSIEKWSRKNDKCIYCKTTKYKHHAHGYCVKCLLIWMKEQYKKTHKPKRWSRAGRDNCIACGSSAKPHVGRGYCSVCFERLRNARRRYSPKSIER